MARTAVVAGTATVVSGAVINRQQNKAQDRAEEAAAQQAAIDSQQRVAELEQQMEAMQSQQAQQAVASAMPAPAPAASDMMTQLTQLSDMKAKGLLTDEEFASAKARLLGGG
jgi:hypothetical protein